MPPKANKGPDRIKERAKLKELGANAVILGVDEAGRGPLAGPVVVAACQLPAVVPKALREVVCDSKKIAKEANREAVFEKLKDAEGFRWTYAVVSAAHIDSRNILNATLDGMSRCCSIFISGAKQPGRRRVCRTSLCTSPLSSCHTVPHHPIDPAKNVFAFIDGNKIPSNLSCEAEAVVKGDATEMCISVASIIAKVVRDRIMHALCKEFPVYNFSVHKGYPTETHRERIMKHGVCADHRRSYQPVKDAIAKFAKKGKKGGKKDAVGSPKKAAKKPAKKAATKPGAAAKIARSKK